MLGPLCFGTSNSKIQNNRSLRFQRILLTFRVDNDLLAAVSPQNEYSRKQICVVYLYLNVWIITLSLKVILSYSHIANYTISNVSFEPNLVSLNLNFKQTSLHLSYSIP